MHIKLHLQEEVHLQEGSTEPDSLQVALLKEADSSDSKEEVVQGQSPPDPQIVILTTFQLSDGMQCQMQSVKTFATSQRALSAITNSIKYQCSIKT